MIRRREAPGNRCTVTFTIGVCTGLTRSARRAFNGAKGTHRLADKGLDPGWDYNVGAKALAHTQDLMAEKIAVMPAEFQAAVNAAMKAAAATMAASQAPG